MSNARVRLACSAAALVAGIAIAWPVAAPPRVAPPPPVPARTAGAPARPSGAILPVAPAATSDARRVALGRRLFAEPRLSGDGRVACASCHDLANGGADGRALPRGIGGAEGTRNTPTVLNAGLNFRQFWDGRAATLEEQIDGPLLSPVEMGMTWERARAMLRADACYASEFAAIYPGGIDAASVRDAIATFERSLVTPDAPFDRWLRGETNAVPAEVIRGYEVFKEVGCTTCHQGENVGGTMIQELGRMAPYETSPGRSGRDPDLGRFHVTGREEDRGRFKVPTLRNVALTAPYLHDGSVRTLGEVVQLMAAHQLGVTLPAGDVDAIVAVMHSLTAPQRAR